MVFLIDPSAPIANKCTGKHVIPLYGVCVDKYEPQ